MKSELEQRNAVVNLRQNAPADGLQALHHAATRLADARRGAPKFLTKELVGLLLSHGARTWRNSMPRADIRLRVSKPNGRQAVRLRIGGPKEA